MEILGVAILVLGLIGASMLKKHLHETKQLKLREILHEERLKAMEHGAQIPDVDDGALIERLFENTSFSGGGDRGGVVMAILWVRIAALCVGLASFLGGIATCAGMYLVADPEMSNYWAMGLIPTFVGLGLLIFYVMSRALARQAAERA